MQAWISGAPLWIFFQTLQYDRAQEIKKRVKFQKKKKKKGQMGNFGQSVVKNCASFYLRICFKDKFQS